MPMPWQNSCSREKSVTNSVKTSMPIALAVLAAAWGLFSTPLLQAQAYHLFADTRALLAIANAADTQIGRAHV